MQQGPVHVPFREGAYDREPLACVYEVAATQVDAMVSAIAEVTIRAREEVPVITTKGGRPVQEVIPKYRLVHSHTARRTGATLMYLSGMDIYDIMKITGHSTPAMLKKYIKADELEVVDKIMTRYDYFK